MSDSLASILSQTEQCVACGMCLPYCPTYVVNKCEAESPRGRISLIKGLLDESIQPTSSLIAHINNCLQCRACEYMCPAYVQYGKIIDSGKSWLFKSHADNSESLIEKTTRWVMRKPARIGILSFVATLYRQMRINKLLKLLGLSKLSGLDATDKYVSKIHTQHKWHEYYPPGIDERGRVAMFLGCISRVTDVATITSAIEVLNKLGYGVYVPVNQTCCGALDYHSGDHEHAIQMVLENINVFSGYKIDAIISTSSGCGGFMQEYRDVVLQNDELHQKASEFSGKISDISSFLNEIDWPESIKFRNSSESILQHIPCSLSNIMHNNDSVVKLLSRIPGLGIENLPSSITCCGAGGLHVLRGGNQADILRDRIQDYIRQSGAKCVVTSNIGCALQISCTEGDESEAFVIRHPVDLLNQYID